MSLHTREANWKNLNIKVELIDDSKFAGVSEFKEHPVVMILNDAVTYLRREEAEVLCQRLNMQLGRLDAKDIERSL